MEVCYWAETVGIAERLHLGIGNWQLNGWEGSTLCKNAYL